MAAGHEEGCYDKSTLKRFPDYNNGLPNDDVGEARGTVFQEIRPGSWLQNRRFRRRKVGGATVERLVPQRKKKMIQANFLRRGVANHSMAVSYREHETAQERNKKTAK